MDAKRGIPITEMVSALAHTIIAVERSTSVEQSAAIAGASFPNPGCSS